MLRRWVSLIFGLESYRSPEGTVCGLRYDSWVRGLEGGSMVLRWEERRGGRTVSTRKDAKGEDLTRRRTGLPNSGNEVSSETSLFIDEIVTSEEVGQICVLFFKGRERRANEIQGMGRSKRTDCK